MDGKIVASETLPGFTFESTMYGDDVVHRIKVTEPIDLEKRVPMYRATIEISSSTNYYCIRVITESGV
jgi:hypothetical protein